MEKPLRSPRAEVLATLAERGSVPVIRSEDYIKHEPRVDLTRSNRVGMLRSKADGTYHYVLTEDGRDEARALGLAITEPSPDLVSFAMGDQR